MVLQDPGGTRKAPLASHHMTDSPRRPIALKRTPLFIIVLLLSISFSAGCLAGCSRKDEANPGTSADTQPGADAQPGAQAQPDATPQPGADARPDATPQPGAAAGDDEGSAATSLVYRNTQYGFDFSLPVSWKGYSIVIGTWEGLKIEGSEGGKPVATGPIINVRHPQWTSEKPRQDIPIMVFALAQWASLQREEFHIGAAPIGPRELGRNSRYVFALPARYNFAFPEGFEEVEEILNGSPLKAY